MSARPFRLVGDSVLLNVHKALHGAVSQWARDWGCDTPALDCRRASDPDNRREPPALAWRECREGAAGCIWFGWQTGAVAEMQRSLFGEAATSHGASGRPRMAPALAERAFESLLDTLAASVGDVGASVTAEAEPESALFASGAGGVTAHLRLGKLSIVFMMDAASVERLAPRASRALEPLSPVDYPQVLSALPVRLWVGIGGTRVGLTTLMSVGIGDVVVLDSPVDEPAQVLDDSGTLLFPAYLGRMSERIVVEVAKSK